MNNLEECLIHLKKLLALLEEDCAEVERGIKDIPMEIYRETLQIEMNQVSEQIRQLTAIII